MNEEERETDRRIAALTPEAERLREETGAMLTRIERDILPRMLMRSQRLHRLVSAGSLNGGDEAAFKTSLFWPGDERGANEEEEEEFYCFFVFVDGDTEASFRAALMKGGEGSSRLKVCVSRRLLGVEYQSRVRRRLLSSILSKSEEEEAARGSDANVVAREEVFLPYNARDGMKIVVLDSETRAAVEDDDDGNTVVRVVNGEGLSPFPTVRVVPFGELARSYSFWGDEIHTTLTTPIRLCRPCVTRICGIHLLSIHFHLFHAFYVGKKVGRNPPRFLNLPTTRERGRGRGLRETRPAMMKRFLPLISLLHVTKPLH